MSSNRSLDTDTQVRLCALRTRFVCAGQLQRKAHRSSPLSESNMTRNFFLFLALFFVALISGASFAVGLDNNFAGMSPTFFVEKMQHSIRMLTVPLPAVAILGVFFTVASAIFARRDRLTFYLLIAASICLIAGAMITVFGNVPINNQIMTWSIKAPPSNWTALSEKWWLFHTVRTILTMAGLSFLILAVLVRRDASR